MDFRDSTFDVAAPSMELPEDLPADVDEPPESSPQQHINFWLPDKPPSSNAYAKAVPPAYMRRESLLTRQLHSETEHSDEEHIRSPTRGMSTISNWSNPSTVSTAELTSDDGRSVPSPGISPMLPPTKMSSTLPVVEKPLASEPKIIGLDTVAIKDPVEAGLGRKRCITFACGNKDKSPSKAVSPPTTIKEETASPPKRKCTLKFMCPSKPAEEQKPATSTAVTSVKRPSSPVPKHRGSSSSLKQLRVHRGSDSTVTNLSSPKSPRTPRKSPAPLERQNSSPKDAARPAPKAISTAQLDDDSDDSGAEATRFHEFATSEEEPEEWTQESTCYRNRLCVTDTLKKENVIRQLGQEVEEEVLAEEDEDDIDDEDEDEEEQDDEDDEDVAEAAVEDDLDDEEDEESDDGFKSDDEEGFAGSDSEGEGSENEWWTPGGISTSTLR